MYEDNNYNDILQRGEIIYYLAELLTEKKDEILSANRKDMELATESGTQSQRRDADHHNPQLHAPGLQCLCLLREKPETIT